MAEKFAGAEWLEHSLKINLSPFGRKVADILGQVWRGVYHLDQGGTNLRAADWTSNRFIRVSVRGGLATFDSQHLTELVIASHEECVRLEIHPANMQLLRLEFSTRKGRDGSIFERHPTIEQAIEGWRAHLALETPREKISEEELRRRFEARCESCERKAVAAAWNPSSGEHHPCSFGCDTGADLEDMGRQRRAAEEASALLEGKGGP